MLLAKIRGTNEHLRELDRSTVHPRHEGVRQIGNDLFEVSLVLREADVNVLGLEGYDVIVQGDVKELLSQRLARSGNRVTSINSAEDFFTSIQTNDSYLDTGYIEKWTANLAGLFPEYCTIIELPNKTWQSRVTSAVRLRAGTAGDRVSILFTSGVHAGELGGPDSSIYFLYRLISAYRTRAPIILGQKTFNEEHVQDIMEHLDIFLIPCVNPDGRAYVETSRNWWRKNYNPNTGANCIGVDINRNFDFLWSSGIGSSPDPGDDTYRGSAALSEPETRNVQWLLDFAKPDFFMDIHGPSGALLYAWGDAENQSANPAMNFLNPNWDGKRSDPYQEYLATADVMLLQQLGAKVIDATNAAGEGGYRLQQSYEGLYPTTATSDDYAYSRHLTDVAKHKTYAYTFEYGRGDFFPPYVEMLQIINEVNAGMLELCDAAVLPGSY